MKDVAPQKGRRKRNPSAKNSSLQLQASLFSLAHWSESFPSAAESPLGPCSQILAILARKSPRSSNTLKIFAEDCFEALLPFFIGQREGSMRADVTIELSYRMEQKLGLTYLFERVIRLNGRHFLVRPELLPYTLFHEMTHLWLYDCDLDPNHTWRFYRKMDDFSVTGLAIDPSVHVHRRASAECRYVYSCPNCENRWYLRTELRYPIYCGPCHDLNGVEYYAQLRKSTSISDR